MALFGTHTSRGVLLRDDPLSDFRKFLFLTWKHLGLPKPTRVQYDIAHVLQRAAYQAEGDEDLRRLIIMAFRGVGKSWVTSAFVCWLLYINPQLNILVVSASKNRADDFTTFTLRLIREMPVLEHLIPGPEQRNSKISFDVGPARASHAPSVKSTGVLGQMAGSRGDVIIADDIEVPNNSATQGMRDKLSEAVKEFDAILKPGGIVLFLGTPQTEMTAYNTLTTRGYKAMIWPARYPDGERLKNYGNKLAPIILKDLEASPDIVHRTTDPERFTDIDLTERELSYGRSGFALQFLLDTRLSDAERYPLKLADLVVMDVDPNKAPEIVVWASGPEQKMQELPAVGFSGDMYHRAFKLEGTWLPYDGSVMSIDPSGRGTDETGYAVVKTLNSNLFVTKAGGLSGGYSDETLEQLAKIAKDQKVNTIIIESNFGDGMFMSLFKPWLKKVGYSVTCEEVRHSTQKEKRIIDTLEPVMNQHRLIVDKRLIEDDFESTQSLPSETALNYQLFYQLTRIMKERGALVHDDRLDALAIAVGYWTDQMSLIQEDREKEAREERMINEIKKTLEAQTLGLAVMMGHYPGKSSSEGQGWVKTRR